MTVDGIIRTALNPLGTPVYAEVYRGAEKRYIVWNYSDERGIFWANGSEVNDLTSIQVHYFSSDDPTAMKKKIRNALRYAGFSILSTARTFEEEKKLYHIIIEAEIVGMNDDGEE